MSEINLENLLSEVSAESPCGEDISADQSYLTLEHLIQAKQADGGMLGREEGAGEPNWLEIRDKSVELLQRSKNLRVAMYLTLAILKLEGIAGLRDGLSLIHELLERFWDQLYPRLDPDDAYDPLERINILLSLSPPSISISGQDPMKFKQRLMEVPLCNSSRMGRFDFRCIQIAKGVLSVPDDQKAGIPDMSVIDAAFQDTTTEELLATSQAAQEAIEHLTAITDVFSKRAAQGQTPDLSGFEAILKNISKCIQEYLAKRGHGVIMEQDTIIEENKSERSFTGGINSPQEAVLALEKICQYFEKHEPSSPVPLLLRRAQRLVSKSFVEVIGDFCPEAMRQIEMIGGLSSGSSPAPK
jgi:type VI secretion system protein ImpA